MVDADQTEQWESKKRDLLHLFGSIVKSGGLHGKLELQNTMIALDQVLSMSPVGGPVDLTEFDAFLYERFPNVGEINQAMVFFEHRAAKAGVTLLLPVRLRDMDASEKEGMLSDWSGQSQAVTYALNTPAPPTPGERPERTATYAKKKVRRGPHPGFVVFLVVCGVGYGASHYYQEETRGPETDHTKILPDDPAAFKCVDTRAVNDRITCAIHQAEWSKYSTAEREVRIEETKRLSVQKGFQVLRLSIFETGQYLGKF